MAHYRVQWTIDVEADDPREAAEQARQTQLDPKSRLTCFVVLNTKNNIRFDVDLDPEQNGTN